MKYSYICPACGHRLETEAANDDEAVGTFRGLAREHIKTVHPNAELMPDPELDADIRGKMKKT